MDSLSILIVTFDFVVDMEMTLSSLIIPVDFHAVTSSAIVVARSSSINQDDPTPTTQAHPVYCPVVELHPV